MKNQFFTSNFTWQHSKPKIRIPATPLLIALSSHRIEITRKIIWCNFPWPSKTAKPWIFSSQWTWPFWIDFTLSIQIDCYLLSIKLWVKPDPVRMTRTETNIHFRQIFLTQIVRSRKNRILRIISCLNGIYLNSKQFGFNKHVFFEKDYLPLKHELQEKTVEQKRSIYWDSVSEYYSQGYLDSHHDILRQVNYPYLTANKSPINKLSIIN